MVSEKISIRPEGVESLWTSGAARKSLRNGGFTAIFLVTVRKSRPPRNASNSGISTSCALARSRYQRLVKQDAPRPSHRGLRCNLSPKPSRAASPAKDVVVVARLRERRDGLMDGEHDTGIQRRAGDVVAFKRRRHRQHNVRTMTRDSIPHNGS